MTINNNGSVDLNSQLLDRFNEVKTELQSEYTVENGSIVSPGKYENLDLNLVTLWELNSEDLTWEDYSEQDADEIVYSVFELESIRNILSKEDYPCTHIVMWEDAYGFLSYSCMSAKEFEQWQENLYDNEEYIPD